MKIIRSIKKMQMISEKIRLSDKKIGFVPTMGYLHDGHLALVKESLKITDVTVVSIFVNPIQFGPKEDFNSYPQNLKKDMNMLKNLNHAYQQAGVDYIFIPKIKDIYPTGFSTYVSPEGRIVECLCGVSRPWHFKGCATVVTKLFNIVKPHVAFFGQKDFQQCVVIKKMIKDLNFDISIKIVKTVREKDGLAMSSRNTYLSQEERKSAIILYKSLKYAKNMIKSGKINLEIIINAMRKLIKKENNIKIDYISIVHPDTLKEVKEIRDSILIALAVKIGKTRLIDNMLIKC